MTSGKWTDGQPLAGYPMCGGGPSVNPKNCRKARYSAVGRRKTSFRPKKTTPETPGKILENDLGMRFVYIPPGEFMMGSPENEPGRDNDEKGGGGSPSALAAPTIRQLWRTA